jgi:predicted alpha/beta-hydrolase family hydrolase
MWIALALATSDFVGMQPVFTHVPPKRFRSTIATFIPAPVRRFASGGPAWPVPMMIASNGMLIVSPNRYRSQRPSEPEFHYHHSVRGMMEPFASEIPNQPAVRGYLHTHGAGSNCNAPLLTRVAETFSNAGMTVLRCDLPFRQLRQHGPPSGNGVQDRAGLRRAVDALRQIAPARIFMGGHSYGGRQASMIAAEDPKLVEALLLLSYPLHPPNRPEQMRTAHFPKLKIPVLFVHGSRDPFGSLDEMRTAIKLIAAPVEVLAIEGAGHDLIRGARDVAGQALAAFLRLVDRTPLAGKAMD